MGSLLPIIDRGNLGMVVWPLTAWLIYLYQIGWESPSFLQCFCAQISDQDSRNREYWDKAILRIRQAMHSHWVGPSLHITWTDRPSSGLRLTQATQLLWTRWTSKSGSDEPARMYQKWRSESGGWLWDCRALPLSKHLELANGPALVVNSTILLFEETLTSLNC